MAPWSGLLVMHWIR